MKHNTTQIGLYEPTRLALHIEDARSGLDCKCVCIDCGMPLKAVINFKKNNSKKYFQHHNPNNDQRCRFSGLSRETELHLKLKQQITKEKRINAPAFFITKNSHHPEHSYKNFQVYSGGYLNFDEVLMEKRSGNIIPDCIGIIGNYRVAIEIKVTHGIDTDKLSKIQEQGLDCIELYAPKTFIKRSPTSIIGNNENSEWLNLGKALQEKTTIACNQWFEQERLRVERILEKKRQRKLAQDRQQRTWREEELFENMRQAAIESDRRNNESIDSFYSHAAKEFQSLSTYVMGDYSFPYEDRDAVNALIQQVKQQENSFSILQYDFRMEREKLIDAFDYQRDRAGITSIDKVGKVLADWVPDGISDEHHLLLHYLHDLKSAFIENIVEREFSKWLMKNGDVTQVSTNATYEFISSQEYKTTEITIHTELEDVGFGPAMEHQFDILIRRFLKIKKKADIPESYFIRQVNKLKGEKAQAYKEFKRKVIAYIHKLTAPHRIPFNELSQYVYRLSSCHTDLKCLKELVEFRNNKMYEKKRPHAQWQDAEKALAIKQSIQAMSHDELKSRLADFDDKNNWRDPKGYWGQ